MTIQKITSYLIQLLIYLFLIVVFIFAVFPVVYILLSSFKTNSEILVGGTNIFPAVWHFENYVQAWNLANFGSLTMNSVYYTFFVVLGCISTATVAGYVFSRGKNLYTRVLYKLILFSMFISIGTLALYPQLRLARSFGLTGTLWGPIIIRVFGMNATQVFIATGNVNQIPRELDEAARIDGCGFFKTFSKIILPLLKPLIATIGLLAFRMAWSDYLLPYVFTISERSKWPLVVGLVSLKSGGESASSWNLMLAGIGISILPMTLIYLVLNRFFISGLTEGAIKG